MVDPMALARQALLKLATVLAKVVQKAGRACEVRRSETLGEGSSTTTRFLEMFGQQKPRGWIRCA
jgi:hypothetical protein